MKKILLSLVALACGTMMYAEPTSVWTGSQDVTWDNTITVAAEKFTDMKVGDKLTLNFTCTEGDVIELKSAGKKLPGTRFYPFYADNTKMETFVTVDMLAVLKATGLEVCGNKFHATSVEFEDVDYTILKHAIWSGFFWCDNWKTLELFRESFDAYNGQRYLIVNISQEPEPYTYDFNIIPTWDRGNQATEANSTRSEFQIVMDLKAYEGGMAALLGESDRLMFQGNCQQEGRGFNILSIVLANSPEEAAEVYEDQGTSVSVLSSVAVQQDGSVYNLQGQRVNGAVKRGVYVVNGKKYLR